MLTGGIDAALGKSPDTGRPGGKLAVGGVTGATGDDDDGREATGTDAFQVGAYRLTNPSYNSSFMLVLICAELVSD